MKSVNYLLAALGGAVVGAAAAILLAPQKGSDTREAIVDFVKSHCPKMKESKLQRNKGGKVMNGFAKFLAGVIVGGAAVALLTPTSGEDLRARIKEILKRKGLLADQKLEDVVEMIAAEIDEK